MAAPRVRLAGRLITAEAGGAYSPVSDAELELATGDGSPIDVYADRVGGDPLALPSLIGDDGRYAFYGANGAREYLLTFRSGIATHVQLFENDSAFVNLPELTEEQATLSDAQLQPLADRIASLIGLDPVIDDYDNTQPAPVAA